MIASSCSPSSTSEENGVYLVFDSELMNERDEEQKRFTCTLTRDHKATFDADLPILQWKDDDGQGLRLYDADRMTYVEFLEAFHSHCFFYEIDGHMYRFLAEDKDYKKASDYKAPYRRLAEYVFTGRAPIAYGNFESWIFLLDDEQRTVYIFPDGIRPSILPFSVDIDYGWEFSDGVFSFEHDGKRIESSYCATPGKRGYRIQVSTAGTYEYYLVEDEGFDWQDYTAEDFQ